MFQELTGYFIDQGFLPHGYCFSWSPRLLWTTVIANTLIGVAYFTIPLALLTIMRRRGDLRHSRIVIMFAAFILACGTTHFLDVLAVWVPVYWLDAWVLAATAAISLATAVVLWRLIPDIVAIPSPAQLSAANVQLSAEITARQVKEEALQTSEERLRALTENLEAMVKDRTAQLAELNERLRKEIGEREHMQGELQVLNRRLEESLHRQEARSNEMEELNKLGDLMQSCRSTQELAHLLANFSASYLGAPSGAVYLIDAARATATVETSWGSLPDGERSFAIEHCWALRRGEVHPSDSWQQSLPCQHLHQNTRHVCVPLIGNGETLALLHLRDTDSLHARPFLEGVAKRATLALAGLKARESLVDAAMHDPLTGLFNRRYLDAALADVERRASRNERPVGLMMLDLDHFKAVNDQHGHEVGDRVLRELAQHLKASLRPGDIACRYGGEEFTVILDGASLATTQQRAEVFRQAVEEIRIAENQHLLHFTVSIGIAVFPEHGQSLVAVRHAADAALYRAKQNGRNRTETATVAS